MSSALAKMKISCFTYNGERELLRLHVAMLAPFVDRFVVVEARTTFSGEQKDLYYPIDKEAVKEWASQMSYFIIDEKDEDLWRLAKNSPNTQGASHWMREFVQKESIKKALAHLDDEDTVIIGDVDEIIDIEYIPVMPLEKLKLRVYAYYLDNLSSEEFWGPVVGKWGELKDKTLNHVRSDVSLRNDAYAGWHFTSQGGLQEVRRKLNDSYTSESYNTKEVQLNLYERHKQGIDYLGRPFEFKLSENEWPAYLRDHRKEYAHLCKGISAKRFPHSRYSERGAYL